jgi:hypothetical protein
MSEEKLSFQEVEKLLESILVNKSLTRVESRQGPCFIVFSHPTTTETIQSRFIKEKATLEALAEGLPSLEELEKTLQTKQILRPVDEAKIAELEEKSKAQSRLLQLTKIEGRRKDVQANIDRFAQEIDKLKSKTRNLLYLSAERKAEEESLLYICWVSTYNVNGLRRWETFQAFENETDLTLRNSLLDVFMRFNAGMTVKKVRYLARHNLWRIRYAAALKIGGPLFERGLYDLTPDQMGLLYWSSYYQSIYEMMPDDQPSSEIIDDDEALDSYMEAFFKRREEERNEGRVKRSSGNRKGKLSAWDKGEELIITPNHPDYMQMQYSEKRIQAEEGITAVEAVAPNSRRARNRAQARRNR